MKNRHLSKHWIIRYVIVVLAPGALLSAVLVILLSNQMSLIAQIPDAGQAAQSFQTAVAVALAVTAVAVLSTAGLVLWTANAHKSALRQLHAKADRLAAGEVWQSETHPAAGSPGDPLSGLDASIERLNVQLQSLDRMAAQLAAGKPPAGGEPLADGTSLGRRLLAAADRQRTVQNAVSRGIEQWSQTVEQVGEILAEVSETAAALERSTGALVTGLHQQTVVADRCADALAESERAVAAAGQSLESQQQATEDAKAQAEQISTALGGVVGRVEGVQQASADAAQITQSGTERVLQTIRGIDRIRQQVDQLGEKMSALAQGSNEIGSIVGTIEEIASQTNLLAINATIEAAHAESQAHQLTETLLNRFMIGQAHLVRKLIETGMENQPPSFWAEIAAQARIDSIYATDEDGVTIITNDPGGLGFRFPDDPTAQAYAFRELLKQKDGEVCQPPQRRTLDNQIYKYVGVSRRDKPGIIQVGFNTSSLAKFELQIGGFTVVAGEVYQLADRARSATGEIRNLIKNMQKIIGEAVSAMHSSTGEVDGLTRSANEAGNVLQEIHAAFDQVLQLAGQAAAEIGAIRQTIEHFSQAAEQILSTSQQQSLAGQSAGERLQAAFAGLRELAQHGDQNLAAGEDALRVLDDLSAKIEALSNRINEAVSVTDRFCSELSSQPIKPSGEIYDYHTTATSTKPRRLDAPSPEPLPLSQS